MNEPLDSATLDRYAAAYYLNQSEHTDMFIEDALQRHVIDIVAQHLLTGDRVLEMGYGTGTVANVLHARHGAVEVVEGSAELCAAARATNPALTVHHSLFEKFEPEDLFDVVLCLFTLEHVDDPVAVTSLAAIASIASPDLRAASMACFASGAAPRTVARTLAPFSSSRFTAALENSISSGVFLVTTTTRGLLLRSRIKSAT